MEENKAPETPKGIKIDFKAFKIPKLKPSKLAMIFGSLIIGIFIGAVIITMFNVGSSISKETAADSAATYLTGNFLAVQGMSAEAAEVTDEGDYYAVNLDIMQEGSTIDSAAVYVSKDGESLIIGQAYDLTGTPTSITGSTANEPVKEEYTEQDLEKIGQFVECLSTKGVKIYGANWCGWTKRLVVDTLGGFDVAAPIYVECTEQEDICSQEGISGFPTIKINGEVYKGGRTFEGLSEETGCEDPNIQMQVSDSSSESSC